MSHCRNNKSHENGTMTNNQIANEKCEMRNF